MSEWQPIETAPKDKTMFVVIGVWDGTSASARPYKTDPYCVWWEEKARFVRWPHHRDPTHWMPLPKEPMA